MYRFHLNESILMCNIIHCSNSIYNKSKLYRSYYVGNSIRVRKLLLIQKEIILSQSTLKRMYACICFTFFFGTHKSLCVYYFFSFSLHLYLLHSSMFDLGIWKVKGVHLCVYIYFIRLFNINIVVKMTVYMNFYSYLLC